MVRTVLDDDGNTLHDADESCSVDSDKARGYVSKAAEFIKSHVHARPDGRKFSTTRTDHGIE